MVNYYLKVKYLKGKIRNRKEYNNYGELLFECEYLNGERNVKGKEYIDESELKFEGEYLNGEKIKSKNKGFFSFLKN